MWYIPSSDLAFSHHLVGCTSSVDQHRQAAQREPLARRTRSDDQTSSARRTDVDAAGAHATAAPVADITTTSVSTAANGETKAGNDNAVGAPPSSTASVRTEIKASEDSASRSAVLGDFKKVSREWSVEKFVTTTEHGTELCTATTLKRKNHQTDRTWSAGSYAPYVSSPASAKPGGRVIVIST